MARAGRARRPADAGDEARRRGRAGDAVRDGRLRARPPRRGPLERRRDREPGRAGRRATSSRTSATGRSATSSPGRRRPSARTTSTRSTRRGWCRAVVRRRPRRQPLRAERPGRRLAVLRGQAALVRAARAAGSTRRASPDEPLVLGGDYNVRRRPTRRVGREAKAHGGTHVSRAGAGGAPTLLDWGLVDAYRSRPRRARAASRGGTTGPACSTERRHADRPALRDASPSRSAIVWRRDRPRGAQGPADPVRPRAASSSTSTSPARRSTPAGRARSRGSRHGRSHAASARPRDSRRSGILPGPSPVTVRAAVRTWRSRVPQGRTGRRAPRSGRVTSGPMATAPRAATPEIRLVDLEKRFGDVRAVDGVSLDIGGRRVLLAARPVGLRQDDDAADDRRLRAADRRPDPAARPRHDPRAARQAAGEHGLPALRAVPPPRRRRQHRVRARSARAWRRTRSGAASARRSSSSASTATRSASRTSCPAASSSGSRSPGRS